MLVPDVGNALAGWLTARFGDAVLAGAAHNVLGNAQQRAFREAVSGAIVRVTESVPGEQAADRRAFLAAVLVEHRERLEGLRDLPELAAAVHALIDSFDDPSDPHLVAPPGLAEALIAEINLGVLDNARAGGPLAPLAAEANFAELFALGGQLRAALETILARLDAIEHELGDRGAPITINNFIGGWRPLLAGYLDPADARTAILRKPFTGRTWLKREIDAFIDNRDRGYFIVQADAGTGKTAFALWYSGLDQHPIHFTEYSKDARTTASAVRNLAAQLIMLWGLDELAPAGHLPADADWSSWLRQVLTAAAEKRDADDPERPIVLVVDGLDEADERSVDHLPFGLPDDLPTRVYVVATVRTGGLPHQPKLPKIVCDWNKRKAEQQGDLRAFITESVQLRLVGALQGDGLTPAAFVTTLLDRCGDVWLYLHYVLEEIASGYRQPRDVPLLPAGLEDYYHNTIVRFCEQDADETWRVPLLATLAIAVEPLNVETLVSLARLDDHPRVRRFLVGPLRPFLSREEAAGRPDRFRLKHPSFAEFLVCGPGPDIDDSTGHRSEDVRLWRTRLAAECRSAGQRVCDRYLTAWGGLDAGLPDLAAEPSLAQRDGGYPLRALATHLFATGRDEDLHKLLACGRQNRNVWYAAHESAGETQGFLNDVALARRALDRTTGTRPGAPANSDIVSRRVRYALVMSSVAAVFTNITPDLLEVIVNRGRWSPTRMLGTVGRMTDERQQAQALLRIVDSIPDVLVPDAWSIALALRGKHRCRAIAALIPRLPDDLLDGAVQAVADRTQEPDALAAAAALVDRLPDERLNNFPWFAMPTMYYEVKMVVTSLVDLKRGYRGAADRALEYLAEQVDNEFDRCQYLATLIPRLPASAFDRAMAVLADCDYRSDALLALARHAPVDRLTNLLHLAGDIESESPPREAEQRPWLRLMQELGPRLDGPDQEAGALAVARALRVDRSAEAIEMLAPRLTSESARLALHDIEADSTRWGNYNDARWLMIAVGALAKRLPPAEARAVVERYVQEYCHVDDDLRVVLHADDDDEPAVHEAELLAPVAEFLPRDTVRLTVRSICRGISWPEPYPTVLTPALSRLAPTVCLDPTLVREALATALKHSWWRPASRLTVLSALAPCLDDDRLDEAMKLMLPGPVEGDCFAALAALGRELHNDQRTALARRALDAAFEIASESQRILAVGALAPTLPAHLAEESLEFVGSVTHSVIYPRVLSALDNLAPQLPVTALPRALKIFIDTPMREIHDAIRLFERLGRDDRTGAIRHLFGRWHQGDAHPDRSWLWALAPFLTESLAEEALAIARALPVDYARRLSMAALAPRLPDGLRAAVAHEVLELLDVPPDDVSIRIAVLARLAAATVTDEVTAACQRLLSGLQPRDLYRTDYSWDGLGELVPHLPTDLVEIVLGFSTLLFPDERFRVISTLAPRLPERLLPDLVEALESVTAWTGNELKERARALIALATRIPDQDERHRILAAVLDQMVQRRRWDDFEPAFVELIPLLPPPSRSQAVSAAVRQCFDHYRLSDLGPLLSVLEGPELDMVFAEVDRVRDPHERATATAAVLRRAGALADRSMVFRDLDVFGGLPPACTRAEMFAIVGASAWWIRQQGGDRAVAATIDALFDVSRWWR